MTCLRTHLLLIVSVAVLLPAGCREETPPNAPPVVPPPVVDPEVSGQAAAEEAKSPQITGPEVRREVDEAVGTTLNYVAQEKDRFVAASEQKLAAWKQQFMQWSEGADDQAAELKSEAQASYAKAAAKLDEIKNASGGAWEEVKAGFMDAFEDLEASAAEAAAHFETPEAEAPEPGSEPSGTPETP